MLVVLCDRNDGIFWWDDSVVDADDEGRACEGGVGCCGNFAQAGKVVTGVTCEEVVEEGSVALGDGLVSSL
jgi:hypothetical protein